MGAGIAIGMALTYPQRVDRLVLIDGLPDRVRERLASPLMRRAVDSHLPGWMARVGNWLIPGVVSMQMDGDMHGRLESTNQVIGVERPNVSMKARTDSMRMSGR